MPFFEAGNRSRYSTTTSLEAGLVTLPVPDEGLDIVELAHDELLYVTADSARAHPAHHR
ncbi:hypothetical protein ACKI1P_42985 [Streptomyces turgidiscabies]|uniref:Uncharacterized protein n=1 Tax=Streptomyces turgidiscabies (strain Car8) TaxID=698760 RepID=L7F464_STRT8|nr:hypothetical protein STRTUCAR8_00150 [Streptomyces turgidiscabies Car8]